jgi:hypothetical protein
VAVEAAAVAEFAELAMALTTQALAPTTEVGEAVATPAYSGDGRAAVAAVAAAAGGRQKTCRVGAEDAEDAEDAGGYERMQRNRWAGRRADGRAGGRVPRLAQEAALRVSP